MENLTSRSYYYYYYYYYYNFFCSHDQDYFPYYNLGFNAVFPKNVMALDTMDVFGPYNEAYKRNESINVVYLGDTLLNRACSVIGPLTLPLRPHEPCRCRP
jgi:hypothetical protein